MRGHFGVVTVFAALFASPAARADETNQDTSDLEGLLEENVVSAASKTPETTSTAPATSVSLGADDIRRYGIRTIDEAINFLAMGVQLEKPYNTAEVNGRGVLLSRDAGAHVLLLIDGHAVNEQWGGTAYFDRGTGIPIELVDHIEIVLGPGSVLYGSNAMLGVVNIVTKRAKDFWGGHLIAESELLTSLRGAVGVGGQFDLFGHDAEVVAAVEHFEQSGPIFDYPTYEALDGVSGLPRRYSADLPAGTWGGRGDDAMRVRGSSAFVRTRVGRLEVSLRGMLFRRSHPLDSGNFDDPDSFTRDRWLTGDVKYGGNLGAQVQASVRLYADHYDFRQDWGSFGAQDCLAGQEAGCNWRLLGHANWAGLEPQVTVDWLKNSGLVTLLGVDGRLKSVGSNVHYYAYSDGSSPGPVGAFDRNEQSLGAYVQNTYWPAAFAGLNLGARFDVDSRFGNALSPRAAATFLPWSGGALKLIYSAAFRAPTAWEVYYTDPRSQIAGGSAIKPEHVRSVEATFEQRWGTQRVFFGGFRSWWEDLVLTQDLDERELAAAIQSGELLPDTVYANQLRSVSVIDNVGFNAGYAGSLAAGALRYALTATRALTRITEPGKGGELLPIAAPVFGNARVSYALPHPYLPTIGLVGRFAARRPIDDYTAEDRRFAQPLFEFRATLSGKLPLPGLSYRLSANSATARFGPYSDGAYPADGATLPQIPIDRFRAAIGLQYDFLE